MTNRELTRSAELLRLFRTVEQLVFLGNESEARRLCDGVDPEELSELAAAHEREAMPKIGATRERQASTGLLVAPVSFFPESLRA